MERVGSLKLVLENEKIKLHESNHVKPDQINSKIIIKRK